MRTTLSIIAAATLATALVAGCNNPEKAQKEADEARRAAQETTDRVQREADQRKMAARAEADQKQREATLALASAQSEYRTRLSEIKLKIDRHLADLTVANVTATDRTRASNDDKINALSAKRDVIEDDLKQLEGATPETWTQLKDKLDKDLTDARLLVTPVIGKT